MARGLVAVGLAALVVSALPAAAARRQESPYPCEQCLFQVALDGTGLRIVAKVAPDDLSPDRRSMVFAGSAGLQVAHVDGTGRRTIAPEGVEASYSPDGNRVVFVRRRGQGTECDRAAVWMVRVDGAGLTRVEDCASSPSWAPDSRRIAYLGRLATDGTFVRSYPAGVDVSWAPDGRTLAFEQDARPFTDVPFTIKR